MFRFSDATRRLVTTGLFVLLCVIPTAVVIAVGVWFSLPGRVATEERRLSLLLGQPVQIETVRHLRPGEARYEGLEVLDPETGSVVLRCDWLRTEPRWVRPKGSKSSYRQLQVWTGKVEVTATSIDALQPIADRLLQRRIEGAPSSILLTAKQVQLKDGEGEFPPHKIRAELALHPQESKVLLDFQAEGQPKPGRIELVRNRKCQPPADGFLFLTGEANSLPCSFISAILPGFPNVGPASRFQGGVSGTYFPEGCRQDGEGSFPEGWQLTVKGRIDAVDLGLLVRDHIPHEISGLGTLQLTNMQYRAGRIYSLTGILDVQNGQISRSLVASCMHEMGLTGNFLTGGSNELLPYDRLAVEFHLDGSGLVLTGLCPSEPNGALLVGGYMHRIDAPPAGTPPIRPTAAVAAVTSTPQDQLSTSRPAVELLRRVPLLPAAHAEMIAEPHRPAYANGRY